MTPRAIVLAGGGAAAVLLTTAGLLFVQGDSLAAIKVAALVFLVSSIAVLMVVLWRLVGTPRWYRSPNRIAGAMFLCGSVLVLLPILLYLPWAPNAFALNTMPLGLPLLWRAGSVLAVSGAWFGLLLMARNAWRAGDLGQMLEVVVATLLLGLLTLRVIAVQTGAA
jgi:hypothetical protein